MNVEIKICGLTGRDDAAAALDMGADYIGFVLFNGSPRCITPIRLRKILDVMTGIYRAVGVFVNTSRAKVEKIAADCGLFAVQLHGNEKPAHFAGTKVSLWRSIRLAEGGIYDPRPEGWQAGMFLIDSVVPGQFGGTGTRADWKEAALFA